MGLVLRYNVLRNHFHYARCSHQPQPLMDILASLMMDTIVPLEGIFDGTINWLHDLKSKAEMK